MVNAAQQVCVPEFAGWCPDGGLGHGGQTHWQDLLTVAGKINETQDEHGRAIHASINGNFKRAENVAPDDVWRNGQAISLRVRMVVASIDQPRQRR